MSKAHTSFTVIQAEISKMVSDRQVSNQRLYDMLCEIRNDLTDRIDALEIKLEIDEEDE